MLVRGINPKSVLCEQERLFGFCPLYHIMESFPTDYTISGEVSDMTD
jgi:hypothetical protein